MLWLELSLGGQGTPTQRATSRNRPVGQDIDPLHAALHHGTEREYQRGHPGPKGHQLAHHLQEKGSCQEPAITTAKIGMKGQSEMREKNLNTGAAIIKVMVT